MSRVRLSRPLKILIAIVVVLLFANLVVALAKPLLAPAYPAPGELLYATGYDDPADPNWYQYQSALTAQIKDGQLILSADSVKDNIFSDLAYPLNDFDLQVAARQTEGDDPYSEYGVLFRYQDNKNYFLFRVRSDGAYRVTRSVNGKQDDLSAATDPERVHSPLAVGLNWVNDLRVVGKGDHFQFFINGQLLTLCPKGSDKRSTWNGDQCASNNKQTSQELIDSTFSTGKIGLGVYENDSKISVGFDNLLIYGPLEQP